MLAALVMSMTIGTLALKLLETSPQSLTRADLVALSPQTDFNTLVPTAEWDHIAVFGCGQSDAVGQVHFVIDTRDGRPIVRTTDLWRHQISTPAAPPDLACIAIGLKGDFSQQPPTAAQMDTLVNLTNVLQKMSRISHHNVSRHHLGNAFPAEGFDAKLLR